MQLNLLNYHINRLDAKRKLVYCGHEMYYFPSFYKLLNKMKLLPIAKLHLVGIIKNH